VQILYRPVFVLFISLAIKRRRKQQKNSEQEMAGITEAISAPVVVSNEATT